MAPLLKRKGSDGERNKARPERKFIDLADFRIPDVPETDRTHMKVAEIHRFEDVMRVSEYIYNGDILILDCSSVSNDELEMRRIIQEVRSIGREVEGDVAGITKNFIAITPRGISIDRNRIRASF